MVFLKSRQRSKTGEILQTCYAAACNGKIGKKFISEEYEDGLERKTY